MYRMLIDQEKAGTAVLISDKMYFKAKDFVRNEDSHFTMVKNSIHQEDKSLKFVCI